MVQSRHPIGGGDTVKKLYTKSELWFSLLWIIAYVILFSLASVGFVEGEGAVQPAGVADGVWALFCLLPAVGFAIALMILWFGYKLRTADVQVMKEKGGVYILFNRAVTNGYSKIGYNFEEKQYELIDRNENSYKTKKNRTR